ncbi:MAG: RsmD family RNA methyltransferase [Bacteroidales bacterium]
MRIINGYLSGRRPVLPSRIDARPTTDKAREALFNILRNRVDFESIRVLDLFAGTGSISFEFASLGCPDITAVEWNRHLADAMRKNLTLLKINSVRLVQSDVFRFIGRPFGPYDLIFADPPFDHRLINEIPNIILNSNLLNTDGVLILEHGPTLSFQSHPGWMETRHYGKVNFSFFGINNF